MMCLLCELYNLLKEGSTFFPKGYVQVSKTWMELKNCLVITGTTNYINDDIWVKTHWWSFTLSTLNKNSWSNVGQSIVNVANI